MSDIITIDCGGVIFKTLVSTFRGISFFETYLTKWNNGDKSNLFVDSDSEIFKHFLNCLRHNNYVIPKSVFNQVSTLAEYYGHPISSPEEEVVLPQIIKCRNVTVKNDERHNDRSCHFVFNDRNRGCRICNYINVINVYTYVIFEKQPLVCMKCSKNDIKTLNLFDCDFLIVFEGTNTPNLYRIRDEFIKYMKNGASVDINFFFQFQSQLHFDAKLTFIVEKVSS